MATRINALARAGNDMLLLTVCIFTAFVMCLTFLQIATLVPFLSMLSSRLLRKNWALLIGTHHPLVPFAPESAH